MKITKSKLLLYALNTAAAIAFLFLLIYSLTDKKVMTDLFLHVSYYLILLIFIVWVFQTVLVLKSINFSLKILLKRYWAGILTAFILTSLVFMSVKVSFKTLSDETNLLSVSGSMLNNKTCFNVTMGKFYYGNLNSINDDIPKRPLIFPFLVSLLHNILGFRYQNPFILNFIAMFLLLSGMYIIIRQFADFLSSVAAMFFILAYPVVTIFGTSGGFDFLNSAFFMLVMTATYYFIKKPSSVALAFLFASLIMFANIRYESAIFLIVIPVLLNKKIKWQYLKDISYLLFIFPLVSLPYLWQRAIRHGTYQNPEGVPVFSLSSLAKNFSVFIDSLVDFDYFLPYAGFVTIAGILIFVYLAIEILRRNVKFNKYQNYFLFVLVASVLINTLVYFAHFFGDCAHPSSARFFITLSIVFALAPVALRILKPKYLSGTSLLLISAMCFLFYHPIAVEGRFINALTGNRTTERCMDFIKTINDKNILIITERPGQYTALGYGAVNFDYANKNKDGLLREIDRRLYSKVIVFQKVEYESQKPTMGTLLPPDYHLKSLYEIQVTATEFLRISEVKLLETPSESM